MRYSLTTKKAACFDSGVDKLYRLSQHIQQQLFISLLEMLRCWRQLFWYVSNTKTVVKIKHLHSGSLGCQNGSSHGPSTFYNTTQLLWYVLAMYSKNLCTFNLCATSKQNIAARIALFCLSCTWSGIS